MPLINKIFEKLPYTLSRLFVRIPYNLRLGSIYSIYRNQIHKSILWNEEELELEIVSKFDKIFQHSKIFNLYKDKYKKAGVLNLRIKSLADIRKIPLLTKKEIRASFHEFKGPYLQNTGGTTGNPLAFYMDKNAWSREGAHMHHVWERVGYNRKKAKFTFRGINLGERTIVYNCAENEFIINTYKNANILLEEFFKILKTKNVSYFHGYPSAIYTFLKEIEGDISKEEKQLIIDKIDCCFLGSEYPTPIIIAYLKEVWKLDFVSWYGHSEMCVMAYSNLNERIYYPLHTYGYVEVEENILIGTGYHNFDMPLIRYNTGDLVDCQKGKKGLLKSFEIKQGRVGDFIIDKNDKKIPLTAFIFGRHHEIFKHIDYIQIYQDKKGQATLLISSVKKELNALNFMDLKNVAIDFDFIYLEKPLKTEGGKVTLKVDSLPKH